MGSARSRAPANFLNYFKIFHSTQFCKFTHFRAMRKLKSRFSPWRRPIWRMFLAHLLQPCPPFLWRSLQVAPAVTPRLLPELIPLRTTFRTTWTPESSRSFLFTYVTILHISNIHLESLITVFDHSPCLNQLIHINLTQNSSEHLSPPALATVFPWENSLSNRFCSSIIVHHSYCIGQLILEIRPCRSLSKSVIYLSFSRHRSWAPGYASVQFRQSHTLPSLLSFHIL